MRVTDDNLGAWLLKGNADHHDLLGRFALDPHVTQWCVQPNYRTALMRAGQPVLFWASGSKRRDITYGVWGLGQVTGPVIDGVVPLDLKISEPPDRIGRDVLRSEPGLRDLEVLKVALGSNPSFVTVEEFAIIRHLGAW